MLIINGKYQLETPVIVHNVKLRKPPKPEKKAVIEPKPAEPIKQEAKAVEPEEPKKKTAAESKPIETAALDLRPKKEKPKKRPVHGVETRHRTRR